MSNNDGKNVTPGQLAWALVVCAGAIYFLATKNNSTTPPSPSPQLAMEVHQAPAKTAAQQVIDNALAQYRIVVQSGKYVEICAQIETIKAAYLQALDKQGYDTWSELEKAPDANCVGGSEYDDTVRDVAQKLARNCDHKCIKNPDIPHNEEEWYDYLFKQLTWALPKQ